MVGPAGIEPATTGSQPVNLPLIYGPHRTGADGANRTLITGFSDQRHDHIGDIGENWWICGESNSDSSVAGRGCCHRHYRPEKLVAVDGLEPSAWRL